MENDNILLDYILYRLELLNKYKRYLLQNQKELEQVINDVTDELLILEQWKNDMF